MKFATSRGRVIASEQTNRLLADTNWSQSNIQLDKTVIKLHLFNTAATTSEQTNSIKKEENNKKSAG